jgi:hypothetical protein
MDDAALEISIFRSPGRIYLEHEGKDRGRYVKVTRDMSGSDLNTTHRQACKKKYTVF